MTKKPSVGGFVQISGKRYEVITPPNGELEYWSMRVRGEDGIERDVGAPAENGGKGPWKFSANSIPR